MFRRVMMSNLHLKRGSPQPILPDDGKLRLFSMKFCPYAERVHLVLDAKNIPYHTVFINLTEKPEWFLELAASGKVPALQIPGDKGSALIESIHIVEYLDEKYPQNPLHRRDPLQKIRDRILIEKFNEFARPLRRLLFKPQADGVLKVVNELAKVLDIFEEELKSRNTRFFGGSKPGMLDYMIWPWFERIDVPKAFLSDNYQLDMSRFEALLKWTEEMKKDGPVKMNFISTEDHFKYFSLMLAKTPDYDFLNSPKSHI